VSIEHEYKIGVTLLEYAIINYLKRHPVTKSLSRHFWQIFYKQLKFIISETVHDKRLVYITNIKLKSPFQNPQSDW